MKFVRKSYVNVDVELDNNEFVECSFGHNCTVTFSGFGVSTVDGCEFNGATLMFHGPAQVTLAFLRNIAQSPGGEQFVRAILDRLVFHPRQP